ncbi:MAG: hypothetical protein QMD13_06005 [Candidatus Bathyarchaeia archaeon]|nr:hypothetical protein [Candidatus Bathyarchaeia archaeon]MDI6905024.1 hypothetical protein [Candidatus Bathyarchaeia archaeon]
MHVHKRFGKEINVKYYSNELREAFIQHNHQRFQKEFSPHQPYGKFEKYKTGAEKADLEKLTKLIKICGMLLQTKVYLF